MAKKTTKSIKKTKPTLVWKRTKRGRPKKQGAGSRERKAGSRKQSSARNRKKVTVAAELTPAEGWSASGGNQRTIEQVVEQSKFQLGPKKDAGPDYRQAGEFQAHNLPFEYGLNRIILLVVDPKFVFVYWEVQTDKMHKAISHIGNDAKLTLRFKELGTNTSWDVGVYERVGNWYLRLDRPEQNLAVEIGMKNDRGDFWPIASSNIMKLPRTGLARPGPIKWMLVSPTGEKVLTEVEEYTEADYELLKKILGPYFFDLLKRGRFAGVTGSSAENIFTQISEISSSNLSSTVSS